MAHNFLQFECAGNPHQINLRSCTVMYQRILLFPLGRWQAHVLVSLTTCMSDEHVSYKANLQTVSTKSLATMGPPAKRFWMVFFWRAKSGPILRAYWELVDQFLSLHAFIPWPRLWRGATGNRKVIWVSPTQKRLVYQHFPVNWDIHNM